MGILINNWDKWIDSHLEKEIRSILHIILLNKAPNRWVRDWNVKWNNKVLEKNRGEYLHNLGVREKTFQLLLQFKRNKRDWFYTTQVFPSLHMAKTIDKIKFFLFSKKFCFPTQVFYPEFYHWLQAKNLHSLGTWIPASNLKNLC